MKIKKSETLRFTKIDDHAATWEIIAKIAEQTQKDAIDDCLRYMEGIKEIKLNEQWLSIITEEQAIKLIKHAIQIRARKYRNEYRSVTTYEN